MGVEAGEQPGENMIRRLIKRNAHAWTTIAGFWLLFTFFAVLDWRDAHRTLSDPNAVPNYVIWGFQLLSVFLSAYFHRTETPRELLWFGETEGYASGFIRVGDVSTVLQQLALLVPEMTDIESERWVALARGTAERGEASITIPITYRGRPEQFTVLFEVGENDILELSISTHLDLAEEVDEMLALPQEGIEVP